MNIFQQIRTSLVANFGITKPQSKFFCLNFFDVIFFLFLLILETKDLHMEMMPLVT